MSTRSLLSCAYALILAACWSQLAAAQTAEEIAFFEKHIRPVLVKECYSCHSQQAEEEVGGGLLLDTREGIRTGGDLGAAVVPGSVRRSLLIKAVRQTDDDLAMPPEKKLSNEVIARFEQWVAMGAPDPRDGVSAASKYEIDIDEGRKFWAFQPPEKQTVPSVKDRAWPRSGIDRFLLAALEREGMSPVADADPYTLLRRLHFDLTGLPPSPEEIDAFVEHHATDPQAAVAEVTDKLLDSPAFGERWARHWLDVARYAESSGMSANFTYPHAWRYRDWVIDAFNSDMPYNEFVRRQIAGDLIYTNDPNEKAANQIATGFLAIGPKSHDERNRRQFAADLADEQLDATFQAFQALTVACARCHDHKFDPIPQTDYYAVAGIFLATDTHFGTARIGTNRNVSDLIELPAEASVSAAVEPLSESRRAAIERQLERLREQRSEAGRENIGRLIVLRSQIATLNSQLQSYQDDGTPKALAMGVSDRRFTFDTRLLIRGELDQPGDRVRRGVPQVLSESQPTIRRGSGRRELADWIASKENPLTARVIVNRVWLHLIGRGLVATPDNFGASGMTPSHPELLDYLAVEFMADGWSVKNLIRRVVLSRAYQLSSELDPANYERDPDNVFVWRMPTRRLEAEALRDSMLLVGGNLDEESPTGSPVARAGDANTARMRTTPGTRATYRSVYLPIVRDRLPEVLTLFDFPDPSLIAGERARTTIPGQALFLLNNIFVVRQADGLATSLLDHMENTTGSRATSTGELSEEAVIDAVQLAYRKCFSRNASDSEVNAAIQFLEEYGKSHSLRATWTAFSQALIASAEFAQR